MRKAPPFFEGAGPFILHYVRARPALFGLLVCLVLAAGASGVAVQYAMKLLVDGMAGSGHGPGIWTALLLFVGLVATESSLWRLSGWAGCNATVGAGVQLRLDLFDYLTGQPMRYFADNLAGSLGHRITATAGNFGALANAMVWRVVPPCVDFVGAVVLFTLMNAHMAFALAGFVICATAGLIKFGERGRPLHLAYATQAGSVGGELTDVISNMWSVKAFSAKGREAARLASLFRGEAEAQRKSWLYLERTRALFDLMLWVLAGGMLTWAVHLWLRGTITPGDVVVVSTLTFRILHGSRDLALALVEMVQQFSYTGETLRVIGQPQTVVDVPGSHVLAPEAGGIEFRNVGFSYGGRREALRDGSFQIRIARAFLKAAPIIIVDEATSALDSESELAIQQAMVERMRDRTVVAVAHRLSTLAAFDRILVVRDGAIVEDGSPTELRLRGGLFNRMWRQQSEGLGREDPPLAYANAS